MKNLKWIGIGCAVLVFVGAIASLNKSDGGQVSVSQSKNAATTGYILQPHEAAFVEYLLKDDVVKLSNGDEAMLGEGLMTVSVVDVAKAYDTNQVAADKKYYKKPLLLSGKIESINSGLGNEPYIVMRGVRDFIFPQANFEIANVDRISELKKGKKIILVCDGAGAIVGAPIFKNCQFPDDYANKKAAKLKAEITEFLAGNKPQSELIPRMTIVAISIARSLPEKSDCFAGGNKCAKEVEAIIKGKTFENKVSIVSTELKSVGLHVPQKVNP